MILVISFLLDNENTSCENGQAVSILGGFCDENLQCPLTRYSVYAMTSNCSKSSNNFCPLFILSSKICMDSVNVNTTDYCSLGYQDEFWKCPNAMKGINFEQCYDM